MMTQTWEEEHKVGDTQGFGLETYRAWTETSEKNNICHLELRLQVCAR